MKPEDMELVDFSGCALSNRCYGGRHGRKLGILYQGEYYLLKFRSTTVCDGETIVKNDPICEHLGSEIYRMLGIPVQKTMLGKWKDEIVVACRDFRQRENEFLELQEFRKLRITYDPAEDNFSTEDSVETDVLKIFAHHPMVKKHPEIQERFWDMIIVDAFLGNPWRYEDDWGILVSFDGTVELAPVYDNGACLSGGADEQEHQKAMTSGQLSKWSELDARCPYAGEDGQPQNPFFVLLHSEDEVCQKEVLRLYPVIKKKFGDIATFLNHFHLLSDFHRIFYPLTLTYRLDDALRMIYNEHMRNGAFIVNAPEEDVAKMSQRLMERNMEAYKELAK